MKEYLSFPPRRSVSDISDDKLYHIGLGEYWIKQQFINFVQFLNVNVAKSFKISLR